METETERLGKQTWTTGEELLLACAVKRHGFENWDSVAMELQTRTSLPLLLTAQNCRQKFKDLKRRFMDSADGEDNETTPGDKIDTIPWLDELRKLRVAELKQEVHRHDVSILSLQLKVKKLKEEREYSLTENKNDIIEKPDLQKNSNEEILEEGKKSGDQEPDKSSPEKSAGKFAGGEDSDRENQSFNESNSTSCKGENLKSGSDDAEKDHEAAHTSSPKPDPVPSGSKLGGEDSYKGSTDTQAKKGDVSGEVRDSVAESKEEEGLKESSDVQSSASLTRKRRRKKGVAGRSSGEEPETDEVSPALKLVSVKSEPLVAFLEIIRSHQHCSLFERRLQSQETEYYKSVIRQHVDLQTIQTKLQNSAYSACSRAFFRDLLLLCNNAIIFFRKASLESTTALQLRNLVSGELEKHCRVSDSQPELEPSPPFHSQAKQDPDRPDSLLAKHKSSAPIIVCRKRSSLSAKASSSNFAKKAELQGDDKKPSFDLQPPSKYSAKLEEEQSMKAKDRSVTGARSLRRISNKSHTGSGSNSGKKQATNPSSVVKGETPKTDKKNNKNKTESSALGKKGGAADFLKRIKRNSPLKSSENETSGGGGRGGESKRGRNGKGGERRKNHNSSGKMAKEDSSPWKRSVGRPPKKAAAAPAESGSAAPKRGREETGKEAAVGSKRQRKGSRR